MEYTIQTPEGQRFSSESPEDIRAAVDNGTLPADCWAWHEGLPDWVALTDLLATLPPPVPQAPAGPATTGLDAAKVVAGRTAGLLTKAGTGLAGFAAKRYRKATLQNRFSKALAAMLEDGKLDDAELEALQ